MTAVVLAVSLVSLFQGGATVLEARGDMYRITGEYARCVSNQGEALERSGESADTVADAAVTACEPIRNEVIRADVRYGVATRVQQSLDWLATAADRSLVDLEVKLKAQVRLDVLRKRAGARAH